MPKIEFLYDCDCPNVEDARAQLRLALDQCRMAPEWIEWERNSPDSPARARRYGSPTVLVDGQDVAGEPPADDAPSCRVYTNARGRNRGVPDASLIAAALLRRHDDRSTDAAALKRANLAALLPAIGTALLPKLTCPACWPAYAGLLAAMGLGFVDYTPWLMPATVVFVIITLIALARRPRRGYAPLAIGLLAGALVLVGKFGFDSETATYAGVAFLVAASAWNAWPTREPACPDCPPAGRQ
jgi:mercuric ion transport protein